MTSALRLAAILDGPKSGYYYCGDKWHCMSAEKKKSIESERLIQIDPHSLYFCQLKGQDAACAAACAADVKVELAFKLPSFQVWSVRQCARSHCISWSTSLALSRAERVVTARFVCVLERHVPV